MNKTKIEWTDYSWNPITGCTRGCNYCYARRMANRLKGRAGYNSENPFDPTFHPSRLTEPLKEKFSSMIFTCSMGDFFGPEILETWREEVYKIMEQTPWHIYQVLTKRKITAPIERKHFPRNMWVGISIDGTSPYWKKPLTSLKKSDSDRKFVSFEPLLGEELPNDISWIDWAIIGAQTGPGAKMPEKSLVRELIDRLKESDIPIFVKPNLRKHFNTKKDHWWVSCEEFPEKIKEVI